MTRMGMSPGVVHERAMRSREVWLEVASQAGIWHERTGALVLAYHEDERAILHEFAGQAPGLGYPCTWLDTDDVLRRSRAVRADGLRGGLWSPAEVIVDPREAIAKLPAYLGRVYGVTLRFGAAVTGVALPYVEAGGETWRVERAVVCSGADLETLYPATFVASGLTRCKLQMMRTVPQPGSWRLGPMLATGLSLRHYPAFATCPSLTALKGKKPKSSVGATCQEGSVVWPLNRSLLRSLPRKGRFATNRSLLRSLPGGEADCYKQGAPTGLEKPICG